MLTHLKCYLSAPFDVDATSVTHLLHDRKVEIYELYDGSIGNSFQDILKRKLRQVDFAIFIVTKENMQNALFEMGVCEGIGTPALMIVEQDTKVPFYLNNRLLLATSLQDRNALELNIDVFLEELKLSPSKANKTKIERQIAETYNENIKHIIKALSEQVTGLRERGRAVEMEHIVEEVFKTLRMKYVQNSGGKDSGVDFAIWNDKLGRILGNPIILECKIGNLNAHSVDSAVNQLTVYSEKSESSVAILLYLDRNGRRFHPRGIDKTMILSFDLEDFLAELVDSSFESLILSKRNAIAHNIN